MKFNYTTQELVDLYVFNTWSAPWKKRSRQRIGFFIPIAFILLGLALLMQENSMVLGIIYLVISGLWLVFYNKIYTIRLSKFAKGYYNHQVNERFWAEQNYDFKEEHIVVHNEYMDARIKWKAIINVIERDDVFWLFETLTAAHIIPKRVMSEKEQDTFKRMLAAKLVNQA